MLYKDIESIKHLIIELISNNRSVKIIYRLDFSRNVGVLAFVGINKESKQFECSMIGFESMGRLIKEAFEQIYGKSKLLLSTMRREEFQAENATLVLHPYWKIGIFEVEVIAP